MECPKCGLENNESNKFCQGCGTPMQQTSDAAPSSAEIQQQPKKAWYKRWWIWLIIGLGVITLLLGGTCTACTCALLSQPVTNPTSESSTQEQSTAFTPYYTDSKRKFHNISYEYNSHWNESESTLKNGYEYHIDNPKISLAVYALTYSSEQDVETLINEYRKTKESGKLIDEETYEFEKSHIEIHRFMRTNTDTDKNVQYNDIATLAYLGYYYTFIVKSDYDNRYQCEDVMQQTINSLTIYEEETTAPKTSEPTTAKSTEPPTEKKSEKPTEKETVPLTEAKKETVIFNNMGITVTYTGVEYHSFKNYVNLRIENNSGHDYTFQLRDVSVNGYMITPVFSCDVKDGKIANDELTFFQSDLDKNGIKEFETIELSIHAFNWDDHSNDFDSEMITFNP